MSTVISIQFGSGKRRDESLSRRRLIIVETAIYRIFSDLEFSSKNFNRTILTVRCNARDV
ncbi:MAG: hypothetical protein V7K77_17985 [Nostoc sp.]|uniref:hypothetical protein n=1 Tax=Nostoc sp. TaxID=1180 RepID=UPI002FF48041